MRKDIEFYFLIWDWHDNGHAIGHIYLIILFLFLLQDRNRALLMKQILHQNKQGSRDPHGLMPHSSKPFTNFHIHS